MDAEDLATTNTEDGLVAKHVEDVDWLDVLPQRQGDRQLAIHLKVLVAEPDRLVTYTRYDPDLVVEPHWHDGDEVIYVLEGEMTICGRRCGAGTGMLLRRGTHTGPIVAGPEGTTMIEVFFGADAGKPNLVADPRWDALVAERGIRPG